MKTLLMLACLMFIKPAKECSKMPDTQEQLLDVGEVSCQLKEASHGWKLWLVLKYRHGQPSWKEYEPKDEDHYFFKSTEDALERCDDWRECISVKIRAAERDRRGLAPEREGENEHEPDQDSGTR